MKSKKRRRRQRHCKRLDIEPRELLAGTDLVREENAAMTWIFSLKGKRNCQTMYMRKNSMTASVATSSVVIIVPRMIY